MYDHEPIKVFKKGPNLRKITWEFSALRKQKLQEQELKNTKYEGKITLLNKTAKNKPSTPNQTTKLSTVCACGLSLACKFSLVDSIISKTSARDVVFEGTWK